MPELTDKIALVTGAGRGIGRGIAYELARQGACVALVGRSLDPLQRLGEDIRASGGQALALVCDVSSRQEVEALAANVKERLGVVQILVNNAGMAPASAFLDTGDDLFENVLRVNLFGVFYCCKHFLPDMLQSRWGRIINIASTTAKKAYPHTVAYTTSKHAVLGLTRVLALETAKAGITVNAICPGYVDTHLTRENARLMAASTSRGVKSVLELFAGTSPQQRLIEVDEVARLAVFLASHAAAGITGQGLNIDGGAVMS